MKYTTKLRKFDQTANDNLKYVMYKNTFSTVHGDMEVDPSVCIKYNVTSLQVEDKYVDFIYVWVDSPFDSPFSGHLEQKNSHIYFTDLSFEHAVELLKYLREDRHYYNYAGQTIRYCPCFYENLGETQLKFVYVATYTNPRSILDLDHIVADTMEEVCSLLDEIPTQFKQTRWGHL